MFQELKGKKVLFITTKNLDYIRNTQEINLLQETAYLDIIGFFDKNYLKRIIKIYFKLLLLNKSKYDVIFCGFAPQLIVPFWKIKFHNSIFYIDFFISLYDTFVNDRKRVKKGTVFAKILKKIDIMTLKRADRIIVDTKAHGNYFVKELGADAKKIVVLYLEADKTIYFPRTVKKSKIFENKFLVLYFGSILPLQGVNVILDAIEILKDNQKIHFVIIGPVEKNSANMNLNNVTFINWLPQSELANYIAQADLCLAGHFEKSIGKARRTIAGKTYIYKAMNKAVVLGDNEANRELFKEGNGNYFVPMSNANALAELIERIYQEKSNEKLIMDISKSAI